MMDVTMEQKMIIEKKLMLTRCARDDDSRAVFNAEIRDVERKRCACASRPSLATCLSRRDALGR